MPSISGWAYHTELLCNPHMRDTANAALKGLGKTGNHPTAQSAVDAWAEAKGIDPRGTHDTNDHPFPVFSTDEQSAERCHIVGCGETLYGS